MTVAALQRENDISTRHAPSVTTKQILLPCGESVDNFRSVKGRQCNFPFISAKWQTTFGSSYTENKSHPLLLNPGLFIEEHSYGSLWCVQCWHPNPKTGRVALRMTEETTWPSCALPEECLHQSRQFLACFLLNYMLSKFKAKVHQSPFTELSNPFACYIWQCKASAGHFICHFPLHSLPAESMIWEQNSRQWNEQSS